MEDFVRIPMYRDPIGTNTSSESPEPYHSVANASGERSALSSYEIESSLRLATTALRAVTEAAWKVRAHEDSQALSRAARTTQAPEAVSPFMQKLMLYCGLLALSVEELRSIVPIPRATAVTSSSKEQESSSSSPQMREPFSRSSTFRIIGAYEDEPPMGSVVLDSDGDAWQRQGIGWNCAMASDVHSGWPWQKLTSNYTLRLIYSHDYL